MHMAYPVLRMMQLDGLHSLRGRPGVALCPGAPRALRRQHQVFAQQRRKRKYPLCHLAGHPSDPDWREDLIEGLP